MRGLFANGSNVFDPAIVPTAPNTRSGLCSSGLRVAAVATRETVPTVPSAAVNPLVPEITNPGFVVLRRRNVSAPLSAPVVPAPIPAPVVAGRTTFLKA